MQMATKHVETKSGRVKRCYKISRGKKRKGMGTGPIRWAYEGTGRKRRGGQIIHSVFSGKPGGKAPTGGKFQSERRRKSKRLL